MVKNYYNSLLGLLALAVVGCGASNTEAVSIQGKVTFDAVPIDSGSISFLPDDGSKRVKVATAIENGHYAVTAGKGASVGSYRVEINWAKKTGRQIPSADPGISTEETIEGLPTQFNTTSTLQREVKPGVNSFDFELDSIGATTAPSKKP